MPSPSSHTPASSSFGSDGFSPPAHSAPSPATSFEGSGDGRGCTVLETAEEEGQEKSVLQGVSQGAEGDQAEEERNRQGDAGGEAEAEAEAVPQCNTEKDSDSDSNDNELDDILGEILSIYGAIARGSAAPREEDYIWEISSAQFLKLQHILRSDTHHADTALWLQDKGRQEYDPLAGTLRLRMPTSLHELVAAEFTRRLRDEFAAAIDRISSELRALLPGRGRLLLGQSANVNFDAIPAVAAASSLTSPPAQPSSQPILSPDQQICFSGEKYPALVVECEFTNPLPPAKAPRYIEDTDGKIRSVVVVHLKNMKREERAQMEGKQHPTHLSVYSLTPCTPAPGHHESNDKPSFEVTRSIRKQSITTNREGALTLQLWQLDEHLSRAETISISFTDIQELVDSAAETQRKIDGSAPDRPSTMYVRKRAWSEESEDDDRDAGDDTDEPTVQLRTRRERPIHIAKKSRRGDVL